MASDLQYKTRVYQQSIAGNLEEIQQVLKNTRMRIALPDIGISKYIKIEVVCNLYFMGFILARQSNKRKLNDYIIVTRFHHRVLALLKNRLPALLLSQS